MKKKSRVRGLILTGVLLLALTACGSESGSKDDSKGGTSEAAERTTASVSEVTTEKTTGEITEATTEKTTRETTEATTEKTTKETTEATTEKTTEADVNLEKPSGFYHQLDGKYYTVYWDEVPGATEYEIRYPSKDGTYKTARLDAPSASLKAFRENNILNGNIYVKAIMKSGNKEYSSDEASTYFEIPEINLEDYNDNASILLDRDSLIKWGELQGYKYKEIKDGDITIIDLYCEDSLNSGFWNNLGRGAHAALGGLIQGFTDEAYDTAKTDLSSAQNILFAILEHAGVESYLKDKVGDFAKSGLISALEYGLQAIFMDTDLHNVYYYKDTDAGAICSEQLFLVKNREAYAYDNYGGYETAADGSYHFNKKVGYFDQCYNVHVSIVNYDNFEYYDFIIERNKDYESYDETAASTHNALYGD